tara:strand:- start:289 stop:480 length:192 start_codon:yes stop_codon:yes gene_type:complete
MKKNLTALNFPWKAFQKQGFDNAFTLKQKVQAHLERLAMTIAYFATNGVKRLILIKRNLYIVL